MHSVSQHTVFLNSKGFYQLTEKIIKKKIATGRKCDHNMFKGSARVEPTQQSEIAK